LGEGAFGKIYECQNIKNKQTYAAKIEYHSAPNPQLYQESKIMTEMKGKLGFPTCYQVIYLKQELVMVTDLLGPNIQDIMDNIEGKKFTMKSTLLLTEQMLKRLRDLHEKGIIHRDMKPENFVIGKGKNEKLIYMIDFGLSRHYLIEKTQQHIPMKSDRAIVGTLRYISMNCHEGLEVSRRDDLESLAYMMIHFVIGELPWMGIKAKSLGEKYKRVYEKKQETVPDDICKILPDEMKSFLQHILNLEFEEKPNYDYLEGLIKSLKSKYGFKNDDNFEWLDPSIKGDLYIKISQNKNEKHNSSAMNNFVLEDNKEDDNNIIFPKKAKTEDIDTKNDLRQSNDKGDNQGKNNLNNLNRSQNTNNNGNKNDVKKNKNDNELNQGNNNDKNAKNNYKSFRTDLRRRK
jgi:serine/threonine protein kinase